MPVAHALVQARRDLETATASAFVLVAWALSGDPPQLALRVDDEPGALLQRADCLPPKIRAYQEKRGRCPRNGWRRRLRPTKQGRHMDPTDPMSDPARAMLSTTSACAKRAFLLTVTRAANRVAAFRFHGAPFNR